MSGKIMKSQQSYKIKKKQEKVRIYLNIANILLLLERLIKFLQQTLENRDRKKDNGFFILNL